MPDINWGGDATTAPFSSSFDETAGNFILAEDNDGSVVLLEWDGATWQYRGPVAMNGEDISGVGTLTAATATADVELAGPTASEGDVVTVPDNPDTVPIFFDAATGQPLVPNLEETV